MKRIFLITALALALAGCAGLGNVVSAVTTTVTNPVTATNLHQAKLLFVATQEAVLKYQRDCFGSQQPPYPVTVKKINADPVLAVQCKRRVSRYNAMKVTEDRAYNAIVVADGYIARNPTGNAASYIVDAVRAVNDYRSRIGL